MEDKSLIPFVQEDSFGEGKEIRKIWHNDECWFATIDIIEILAETSSPSQYWTKIKKNLTAESQLQPFWLQLKIKAADGKNYKTDCTNTEGVFRIIMSVPSPKAEPLKMWLAQVGKERIEETENPELTFERAMEIYKAKGHTDEWIKERWQSISTRKQLTNEWKARGIKEGQEYGILTATIAKGTFGMTPSEHGQLKGLEKQNLRDHMTPLELIFTSLSEEATRIITVERDAQGFNENHEAATDGGRITGDARQNFEKNLKKAVISTDNFLNLKNTVGLLDGEDKTEK